MHHRRAVDYIVVGAGSAGCVVAEYLSRDPNNRVLLLESGGWDRSPWIRIPLGWGRIRQKRLFDWGYDSEPEPGLNGRRLALNRGRVIGGTSSINTMAYVRGHRSDFDRWAASGLQGWSYADVLPVFREQECWAPGGNAYRGAQGGLQTRPAACADPIGGAILRACLEAGHPEVADYNAASQHGAGPLQFTIGGGRRCSSADAFLRPALSRPNLRVATHAEVDRLLLENHRVAGVQCRLAGRAQSLRAAAEVILCAGVFDTPRILMRSGIGPAAHLAQCGIAVRHAVEGVGANLQDHVLVPLSFPRKDQGLLQRHMRLDRIAWDMMLAGLLGRGFATEMPGPVTAFLKTRAGLEAPDVQLLTHCGSADARPYLRPFRVPPADAFTLMPVVLRPHSRGRLRLDPERPDGPIRIHLDLLAHEQDRAAMRAAIRLAADIVRQPALQAHLDTAIAERLVGEPESELDVRIRSQARSVHHAAGTCRMGPSGDDMAVVDGRLRVHGIEGLRIADASVMPDLVGGNINATVMMIAHKAAAAISGQDTALSR